MILYLVISAELKCGRLYKEFINKLKYKTQWNLH